MSEPSETEIKLDKFQRKFEKTVKAVRKSNGELSLRPVLIETVKEYLEILGPSPESDSTVHTILPDGRVLIRQGTGEVVVKTHKEFLNQQ